MSNQAAARARAEKAAARVWAAIELSREATGCSCPLRKGMTHADLRKLNGGCTDTPERRGRWVCATLAKYRRMVPQPIEEDIC